MTTENHNLARLRGSPFTGIEVTSHHGYHDRP
jgi:hypothetical protein